jgi:hypothetical protein
MKLPITQPHDSRISPKDLEPNLLKLLTEITKRVKNVRFETLKFPTTKTNSVSVFLDWEYVGTVSYGKYTRKLRPGKSLGDIINDLHESEDKYEYLYSVQSRYITNSKRPRDAKVSVNLRPVLKECVRVLKSEGLQVAAHTIVSDCKERAIQVLEKPIRLMRNFSYLATIIGELSSLESTKVCILGDFGDFCLQNYREWVKDKPDLSFNSWFDEEAKQKIKDKIEDYDIAVQLDRCIKQYKAFYVRIEKDETINVAVENPRDSSSANYSHELVASTHIFEELPEMVQDKLTLLKMQKPSTIVKAVGVTLNERLFFIADCDMDHLV